MNSRTSRPRSPTSAITLTSADVDRAIMPSSEDLPTPEPAKMPRRWPRPQGTSASSARTPEADAVGDPRARQRVRRRAGRSARHEHARRRVGMPSSGLPEAVDHAAEQRRRRRATRNGLPVGWTRRAGADPVQLAERHQQRAPAAEADDLGGDRRRGRGRSPTMQTSPTSACRPVASMIRPIRSLTRPTAPGQVGVRDGRAAARVDAARRRVRSQSSDALALERGRIRASAAATISRARASCVSMPASTSPDVGAHDRAAAADAPVGLDLECSIPPSSRRSSSTRSRTSSRSSGLTTSVTRRRSIRCAQRAAHRRRARARAATSSAPARICSASGSASSTASLLELGLGRSPAAARSTSARGGHRARPRGCGVVAAPPPCPAARPSASPAARACGADLLGLRADGRQRRRRCRCSCRAAARRAAGRRSRRSGARPPPDSDDGVFLAAREHERAGLLEPAHDRRRSGPGPLRRRACAAAAGSPSPRRASGRRARTCSPRIRSLTSSSTPRSASARSFWSASREHELDRAVVELDDVLEDEQQAPDLLGQLLVGLGQRVEHVALGRAVGVVEDLGERLDAAGGRVLLLDDAVELLLITLSTCLTTSGGGLAHPRDAQRDLGLVARRAGSRGTCAASVVCRLAITSAIVCGDSLRRKVDDLLGRRAAQELERPASRSRSTAGR